MADVRIALADEHQEWKLMKSTEIRIRQEIVPAIRTANSNLAETNEIPKEFAQEFKGPGDGYANMKMHPLFSPIKRQKTKMCVIQGFNTTIINILAP